MATTVIDCGYINPGGSEGLEKLVHTGSGRLLGFFLSENSGATTISFYDATSAAAGYEILEIKLGASHTPRLTMFPRHQALAFATGLYVEPGTAKVAIWAVLYS